MSASCVCVCRLGGGIILCYFSVLNLVGFMGPGQPMPIYIISWTFSKSPTSEQNTFLCVKQGRSKSWMQGAPIKFSFSSPSPWPKSWIRARFGNLHTADVYIGTLAFTICLHTQWLLGAQRKFITLINLPDCETHCKKIGLLLPLDVKRIRSQHNRLKSSRQPGIKCR